MRRKSSIPSVNFKNKITIIMNKSNNKRTIKNKKNSSLRIRRINLMMIFNNMRTNHKMRIYHKMKINNKMNR